MLKNVELSVVEGRSISEPNLGMPGAPLGGGWGEFARGANYWRVTVAILAQESVMARAGYFSLVRVSAT